MTRIPDDLLSSGALTRGNAFMQYQSLGEQTQLMWPTYKRVTSSKGGDAVASYSFKGGDQLLNQYLHEALGQTFTESYERINTFQGRVHEVRLSLPNAIFIHSLEPVANKVACWYTSIVTGQSDLTQFYEDTDSQNKWGVRYLLLRPSQNMDQGEAEDLAQAVLAQVAEPRIIRGKNRGRQAGEQGIIKITAQGWAGSLDAERHNDTGSGTTAASTQLNTLITNASLVSVGSIASNTKALEVASEWRPVLQRIHWIADQSDASGNVYAYGCFGSKAFDYYVADDTVNPVRYKVLSRGWSIHDTVTKEEVPPALVKPGYKSMVVDFLAEVPISGGDDFRVQRDTHVEYSTRGASLTGSGWDVNERAHAIELAILQRRE